MENQPAEILDEEHGRKVIDSEDPLAVCADAEEPEMAAPYPVRIRDLAVDDGQTIKPLSRDLSSCKISIKIAIFLTFLAMPTFFFMTSPSLRILGMIGVLMASFTALATFIAGIFVMRFMWQARKNLALSGTRGLKYSATWSWLSWFIPIASMFLPCMVMGELWKASKSNDDSTDWKQEKLPREFYVWWGLWLGAGLGMSMVSPLLMIVGLAQLAMGASMCAKGVMEAISALALLKILNEINHRQIHKFPELRKRG